ncbi:FAD-dependent oxidoreductase [Plebeiibacterium sediminum]|uniref:FAD-dependent oxidoreductase n=1 Tax=Plebeiibacterium sediminum TaxID=2992112 RepID=A0AAE3M645_9BACT|nr:FAD-dependent oxidoreductase [Plebeiobacterium sediminum]MCW3787315.1 FAD-dependent oxidoreductase [Plebeiobacterium sediminum]
MDKYLKNTLQKGISRRSFLSRTALASCAAGIVGFTGCKPNSPEDKVFDENMIYGTSSDESAMLSFLSKPENINEADVKETLSYDVVIVGAGASGVPAALSAVESGATVGVLQKENIVISQGNSGAGIDLENSDRAGVEALVSTLMKENAHRCSPELLREWAYHSGEAVTWVINRSQKAGASVINQGNLQQVKILDINGYKLSYHTAYFGPKPFNNGDGMKALAKYSEDAGVKYYFSTPAVQLIKNGAGEIKGVYGKCEDGKYIKLLANKGVILATGDYQNNKAMCDYFIPDAKHFGRKQSNKTGDGFKMGYWAGGVIEPIGHTKMMHDFDAGPATMCDMPFLAVDHAGNRFVNENVEMSLLNNYLRQSDKAGQYSQIFDSNYMKQAANWPGKLVNPEKLREYMPDESVTHDHVSTPFINTYKANTIEELAHKIKADPATLMATVKRYNELAAEGMDSDFGKPANQLFPIIKPPFYGIHRTLRLSAVCSGLLVNKNHQCLNSSGNPIKGLYAIGNLGGGFYGGVDYPLIVYGLSLGRCYTFGYLVGKYVANL